MSKQRLDQLQYKWLKDDDWFDQVMLWVNDEPFLSLTTVPRFKTSPVSGNEWRISTLWQQYHKRDKEWVTVSDHNGGMETAIAAFYGEFYSSFPDLFEMSCTNILLLRKTATLLVLNYEVGKSIHLIHALGHLPHVFQTGFQRQEGIYGWEKTTKTPWWDRCFQTGCPERATITYRLRHAYCNRGEPHNSRDEHVRFCRRHAIRGDSDLQDCDVNYVLIDGDRRGAGPIPEDLSPAVFMGSVEAKR